MQRVVCFILGGGHGSGLYPLTLNRSVPAVPLAGKYRLIDVPVSNCINSGIQRIFVLTQYQSVSLHRHVNNTFKMDPFHGGFVEVLAAQQTNEASDWYKGTGDALRKNLGYADSDACTDVLVLSADQLYRMDFRSLVQGHRASGAACTIPVTPVGPNRARRMGIVELDAGQWVRGFVEKPNPENLDSLYRESAEDPSRPFLASMGIYMFQLSALKEVFASLPAATDLVTQVLPALVNPGRVRAHRHHGFWEDLGTVRSYYATHMALAGEKPPFDFHSAEGVIYTRMRNLPGSRAQGCSIRNTLVSDGCELGEGSCLEQSVIGVRSVIGNRVTLRNTILMGSNYSESDSDRDIRAGSAEPPLGIGDGTIIEQAIIDKNFRIGRDCRLVNAAQVQFADGPFYSIRDGIILLPANTVVPDGTIIS